VKDDEKNGHGRKENPPHLPRERKLYQVPEEKKRCKGCGRDLEKIDEEVTEELEYKPASFFVREHVREKLACKHCQENVVIAEMPPRPVDKGIPGPGAPGAGPEVEVRGSSSPQSPGMPPLPGGKERPRSSTLRDAGPSARSEADCFSRASRSGSTARQSGCSRRARSAQAVHYALEQWDALTRYIEDGILEINNNIAERALRRVAIGRNYAYLSVMRTAA
jgi:zinc-finger binding domain of transposase IS66/Transposase IS66 family